MEIETMNFMENNSSEAGDEMRKRIQKHKKNFDSLRKEMR